MWSGIPAAFASEVAAKAWCERRARRSLKWKRSEAWVGEPGRWERVTEPSWHASAPGRHFSVARQPQGYWQAVDYGPFALRRDPGAWID